MTTKTVFQTDHLGLFVGTAQADQDPLQPGYWLIPAGCVETPPPQIPALKEALWTAAGWKLVDSYRGLIAYNTETGAPREIDRVGTMPSGHTLQVPGPNQVWKNGQWVDDIPAIVVKLHAEKVAAVNDGCQSTIIGGFQSAALGTVHRYASPLDDQVNLLGMVLCNADCDYPCYDGAGIKEFRLHTAEQLSQVGDDLARFKQACLKQANTLKLALDEARKTKDVSALQAITWQEPPL